MKAGSISWRVVAQEPFRLFFPSAVFAGIGGVLLWPLYFLGVTAWYPGMAHARIMAYGFFGGFILGFLGTAFPRMLSAPAFRMGEVLSLFVVHIAVVGSLLYGKTVWGDSLFLVLLGIFGIVLVLRVVQRRDLPPPGFVLVGLALASGAGGAILSLYQEFNETAFVWAPLQHLLAFQGFVLFPILGVGAFFLPRFFDAKSSHDFPESLRPTPAWTQKFLQALGVGALILISFWMEARGWLKLGPLMRFGVSFVYLVLHVPFYRTSQEENTASWSMRIALCLVLIGFLMTSFAPELRVNLLHYTLIGGFALITFLVASRVVFGHSGQPAMLQGRRLWLGTAVGLMLLGMMTRISGDWRPRLMPTHYSYGAVLWVIGVLLWSAYVLPKVLIDDPDE